MIDKIKHENRVGIDLHENLIELLKYSQESELPKTISEDEYNLVKANMGGYPNWYVGLVGFCGSFGAKYFGGFARRYNKDGTLFDVPRQAINSLRRQSKNDNFKNIKFIHMDFRELPKDKIKGYVIYCDPPYKNTTQYDKKIVGEFPYDEFYEWAREMSKSNIVLISEYSMPDDFECIWQKELKTSLGSGVNVNSDRSRVEKLFIHKSQKQM